jgi:Effector-associated domain 10
MVRPDPISAILDRIADNSYTSEDLQLLSHLIKVRGDSNVIQLGRYNVRLERGRDIHIGDRIYQGYQAEAIRAMLLDVLRDGVAVDPIRRGSLRGFAGFIITVGILTGLVGMAMFLYGLITVMTAPGIPSGPPPVLLQGFAIAFAGVVVTGLGHLVRGWERPRSGY